MKTDQLAHAWQGTIATMLAVVGGDSLETISRVAAIFAQVGAGLAGLVTAGATIYWLVKGKQKPGP